MSQSTMKFASDSPQFSYVELTLNYYGKDRFDIRVVEKVTTRTHK
ncbi:hypothetical protein LEP1GSC170_2744 [Leptospira interrogans serovar Bataviae str. HAI135]|nr:hypothetical protein LEP1GSC170_2744 [Leptospira interrogans serovar Bataviae str. HAI135]